MFLVLVCKCIYSLPSSPEPGVCLALLGREKEEGASGRPQRIRPAQRKCGGLSGEVGGMGRALLDVPAKPAEPRCAFQGCRCCSVSPLIPPLPEM